VNASTASNPLGCVRNNRHSALKVVKSANRYAETAKDEIKLLKKVMAANPHHPGREHVISFLDAFQHRAHSPPSPLPSALVTDGASPPKGDVHVCIVCEPLGENLLSLLERHKKHGVPLPLVKVIARQLLLGLQYLHEEAGLIHTDIKPENVMVSLPDPEAHIRTELSTSPSPTSRRVGVPLAKTTRTGMAIPRVASNHAAARLAIQRQVEIFDSQPLSAPAASSPGGVRALALSRPMPRLGDKSSATVSISSSVSTPAVFSFANTPTPTSALSTPGTSLGSMFAKVSLYSDGQSASPPKHDRKVSAAGPSLLSQTAPMDARPAISAVPSSSSIASSSSSSLSPISPLPIGHAALGSTIPLPGIPLTYTPPPPPPVSIKIADLGNATPIARHYTEDIQTRQYRAPEAIIGRADWGPTADVWSAACVVFELLTAEFLFDPQGQGELFSKDDDHMAQVLELVGDFALDAKMGGRFSRELFDAQGRLRYIRTLKPWPLERVMMEKYLYAEEDARAFADFMTPMLQPEPQKRASAGSMVDHPWLLDM
jgi:serine/threonine-protein kinase SRPK3